MLISIWIFIAWSDNLCVDFYFTCFISIAPQTHFKYERINLSVVGFQELRCRNIVEDFRDGNMLLALLEILFLKRFVSEIYILDFDSNKMFNLLIFCNSHASKISSVIGILHSGFSMKKTLSQRTLQLKILLEMKSERLILLVHSWTVSRLVLKKNLPYKTAVSISNELEKYYGLKYYYENVY